MQLNFFSKLAIASSLLLMSSGVAFAVVKNITAYGSKAILIDSIGIYNQGTCYYQKPPKISDLRAENGKLTTELRNGTFSEGMCKGKKATFTLIIYRANPGFRGIDKVSYRYTFKAGEDIAFSKGGTKRFNVTVK